MRKLTSRWWIPMVVLAALLSLRIQAGEGAGSVNRLEVRRVDLGYRLSGEGLKTRLTLITGEAMEYSTEDPGQIDATLRMAEMLTSGRARMFVEAEGTTVHVLQIAIQ